MEDEEQPEWEAGEREVLAGVSFSVFAPEGRRLELSGWGGGDGEPVDMVAVRHDFGEDRWIDVESELAEDDFYLPDAKRDAAEQLGGLSDAPVEVPSDPRPLRVDGIDGERRSDSEQLWKLKERLHAEQGWHHRAGQLLGWPTWQNDDNMDNLASLRGGQPLEWTLLLQTDAVDAELYVVLPTADLAVGRFDRSGATIEHD